MKKSVYLSKTSLALSLTSLLVACSTPMTPAPVVEREVSKRPVNETVIPASQIVTPVKAVETGKGTYVVKKGDTLVRIALEHGQNYRDLVVWNNLANPNDIKVDQVLRVAPVETINNNSVAANSAIISVNPVTEVRPLGASTPNNKTTPRADKRPYNDTNLAELQKADTANPVVQVANAKPEATSAAVVVNKAPVDSEAIDWIWPAEGKVVAIFDDVKSKGVDIAGKMGQDIIAAGSGKVMYAGSGIRGYGNLVIIRHSDTLLSAYAHNKSILVKEGQSISKGQKIAEMGNSDSDNVKLHFEIRYQGKPVDPSRYLPAR